MQDISLLITPATIWSPVYPNLWKCLGRESGLFIFLTQILIWSHSVAVPSPLYLAQIQNQELHLTLISVQYPCWFLFFQCFTACWTVLCSFLSYKWHVRPILAVSGSLLSAAIYTSSRFSCIMFWSVFVTKDCTQSQFSFELVWKKWSPYSTVSSSSRIYIMAHTSVSTTVVYCLQSNFPLNSLPISQYTVHKMRRM
jgi:hypothetical protein